MKKYVVDASVILKWVVGDEHETDHDKARNLLLAWMHGSIELAAPTLWVYEVGNFLGRRFPEDAGEKMDLLINLGIRSKEPAREMYALCFGWMKEYGVTFYDASYLAVALEMQASLVTADEKFVNKMGNPEQMRLLKDIAPV